MKEYKTFDSWSTSLLGRGNTGDRVLSTSILIISAHIRGQSESLASKYVIGYVKLYNVYRTGWQYDEGADEGVGSAG